MEPLKTIGIGAVIIIGLCLVALISRSAASKSPNPNVRGHGFAVLELFTSEGCSSCPPADEILARIQQEAGNTPVYVLAYHVDYWNRLGWKDVFSQPGFSKRQYRYSRQLGAQIYTPQLIINGKTEFVGSDAPAITSAVKDALGSQTEAGLSLQTELHGDKIKIIYQAEGNLADCQLVLAMVQKHAVSKVTNGENEGRTLRHAQIVRNLYTFGLKSGRQGIEEIAEPAGFNACDWEIIGLLQHQQTGAIKGAARAALAGSASIP